MDGRRSSHRSSRRQLRTRQVFRFQPPGTAIGTRPAWNRRPARHDGRSVDRRKDFSRLRMPVYSRQSACSDHRSRGGSERRVRALQPLHEKVSARRTQLTLTPCLISPKVKLPCTPVLWIKRARCGALFIKDAGRVDGRVPAKATGYANTFAIPAVSSIRRNTAEKSSSSPPANSSEFT